MYLRDWEDDVAAVVPAHRVAARRQISKTNEPPRSSSGLFTTPGGWIHCSSRSTRMWQSSRRRTRPFVCPRRLSIGRKEWPAKYRFDYGT